ncbi:hypothetical protein GGS26DRAFT_422670 [Hypomontagnella submonticulosa]|nr:hypothetical protein GGS26DRAFT_422670 [Hypomontagnella submonticulosa]
MVINPILCLEELQGVGRSRQMGRPTQFLRVASKFRSRQPTDSRDRVYDLLGTTSGIDKFTINYGLDVSAICELAARKLITGSGKLDAFSHIIPEHYRVKLSKEGTAANPPSLLLEISTGNSNRSHVRYLRQWNTARAF